MRMQLIRHATVLLSWDGVSLLVDPMLNPRDATDAIPNTPNPVRNPMVDLPMDDAQVVAMLDAVDGVVITHLHGDHWDARAQELTPKDTAIFCQSPDAERIRSQGFTNVTSIEESLMWRGIAMQRTGGQHGTGEIGARMAPVSGFVFRAEGAPCVYLAGDTIWCDEVADVLAQEHPDVVLVNAGAAQFLAGGVITMATDDVVAVCKAAPDADVVAVHMETINHCLLTRAGLAAGLRDAGLAGRVQMPADGETLEFTI